MNNHTMKLINNQQLIHRFIYSLRLIKLKTLKTYIKIYLVNELIKSSNFLTKAIIFFMKKLDESFYLCLNNWSFNNLTINNRYLLLLINKSFN